MVIEDSFQALAAVITTESTVAVTLTGSYARGEPTPYSDIDLHHYVHSSAVGMLEPQRVWYSGDRLVSVSTMTLDSKRTELQSPQTAIWAVEGLRQSQILFDPKGAFAGLQAEAQAFTWDSDMQHKADVFASYQLAGLSEEALKIRSGLYRDHDSTVLYGTIGIVLGLSALILTQRGILLRTENDYFRKARETAILFGALVDFDTANSYVVASPRMRGQAALRYYVKCAKHLDSIIQPEHRSVIATTLDIITRES